MSASLDLIMSSAVYVECRDPSGRIVAQRVFTDWHGRPVPAKGDSLTIDLSEALDKQQKVSGQVVSRHFEVQQADGRPEVWVRLEVVVGACNPRPASAYRLAEFSDN